MTNGQLIEILSQYDKDSVVICADQVGGWDNIEEVMTENDGQVVTIIFGGGSPFSDE